MRVNRVHYLSFLSSLSTLDKDEGFVLKVRGETLKKCSVTMEERGRNICVKLTPYWNSFCWVLFFSSFVYLLEFRRNFNSIVYFRNSDNFLLFAFTKKVTTEAFVFSEGLFCQQTGNNLTWLIKRLVN